MSWSLSRRRGDGVGLGSPCFVLGAASKRVGFVASVRGERLASMPLAVCSRGPRGQRRQSLIALASRCPNVRECVACPGSGSPRCASRRVRSRRYAVGGGGGGSAFGFEQRRRRARRGLAGALQATHRAVAVHSIDATSLKSLLHTRVGTIEHWHGFCPNFAIDNRRAGVV